jgi:hypothetical protein
MGENFDLAQSEKFAAERRQALEGARSYAASHPTCQACRKNPAAHFAVGRYHYCRDCYASSPEGRANTARGLVPAERAQAARVRASATRPPRTDAERRREQALGMRAAAGRMGLN